jgi:hypothetical protein
MVEVQPGRKKERKMIQAIEDYQQLILSEYMQQGAKKFKMAYTVGMFTFLSSWKPMLCYQRSTTGTVL